MSPRKGYFDSVGMETGTNPVLIPEGILMVYSGWGADNVYQVGGVLFSNEEPARVLWRSEEPILEPAVDWEARFGVSNHVVREPLLWHRGRWWLYYGAADKVVCLAFG